MWTALLLIAAMQDSLAAWPDDFKPRVAALKLFRKDLESSISLYRGKQRRREYIRICDWEDPKPYFPACEFNSWTNPDGRSNALKSGEFFAKRCREGYKEQLSCVISGWASGFIAGKPSADAVDVKGAISDFRWSCEKRKYGAGCAYLGDMYFEGVGVSQDKKRSFALYDEACKAKDTYGCYKKGVLSLRGEGGQSKDVEKALALFAEGCKNEHAQACIDLGKVYEIGREVKKDLGKAEQAYRDGCALSSGNACFEFSRMTLRHNKEKSALIRAATLFTDLCQREHPMSCYHLGLMMNDGLGIEKDQEGALSLLSRSCGDNIASACTKASQPMLDKDGLFFAVDRGLDLLSKGCSLGDPIGCVKYAGYLEKGEYTDKDPMKAKQLYEETCNKKQGVGCQAVGRMYQDGKIVPQDFVKSREFLSKGCWELYDAASCGMLGQNYYLGQNGVLKNSREAFFLLDKACEGGSDYSCGFLGSFYIKGDVVKRDDIKSLALLEKGCKAKNIEACYHAGMLIVEGRIPNADYQQAWNNLKVACRNDMEEACEASKPIVYQVRFENVLTRAAEQKRCEIWTQYPDSKKSSRHVARINQEKISILSKKGKEIEKKEYTFSFKNKSYKETETKKVAASVWTVTAVGTEEPPMDFDHHENWLFLRFPDPILSFAVDETFSKEQNNEFSLFYSRETERIRKERDSRCMFVDKAPELLAENCTEIQALLGAQLLSTCQK